MPRLCLLKADRGQGAKPVPPLTMGHYNTILTEAIFELVEEKGLLNRDQVKERIEQLKAETKLSFQMIQ